VDIKKTVAGCLLFFFLILFLFLKRHTPQTIRSGCAKDTSSDNMFGVCQSAHLPTPISKNRK
jgi:hypothetical protein